MEKLKNHFNEMESAKKNNRLAIYIIVGFALVVTLSSLILNFMSKRQMIDLVKVVDVRNGVILHSEVQRRSQVLKTSIQGHLTRAITYANSFSRTTIKSNQKATLFLMDMDDAYTIFGRYKSQQSYEDALQRGHIYKTSDVKITHLNLDQGEPYQVKIEARLTIKDGTKRQIFLIQGQGAITYHDPIYPQNEAGLWLTDYRQKYTNITSNE